MSVSRPLGLHQHLTRPGMSLEIVPLFDVLLIALMLTLLSSRFIFAPGVSVELPRADAASVGMVDGSPTVAVLTLLKDNSLIYGGRLLSVENFEREVTANPLPPRGLLAPMLPSASSAAAGADPVALGAGIVPAQALVPVPLSPAAVEPMQPRVLLIKGDARVSLSTLLQVMNAARKAGYDRVQIAEQLDRGVRTLSGDTLGQ